MIVVPGQLMHITAYSIDVLRFRLKSGVILVEVRVMGQYTSNVQWRKWT